MSGFITFVGVGCAAMLFAISELNSFSFSSLASSYPNGVVLIYEPYYNGMRLVAVFSQYIHTEK